jgi:hypothetical protein
MVAEERRVRVSKFEPAQAWVDAGYPDHEFDGDGQVCTECNAGRDAVQHIDWSQVTQRSAVLYLAERHMRALHKPVDEDYAFWGRIADGFNSEASAIGRATSPSMREVSQFNRAVKAAYGYLDMVKRGKG